MGENSHMGAAPIVEPKPQRGRRSSGILAGLRKDTAVFAHCINKQYRDALSNDLDLKEKILRYLRAVLRPRPRRRGRPRNPEITRALLLYSRVHREYPKENPRQNWHRVCIELYPDYEALAEIRREIFATFSGRA